jgi:hypothetical protein
MPVVMSSPRRSTSADIQTGDHRRRDNAAAGSADQNLADGWPYEPGHGLWLARQVADKMMLRSDPRGTRAVLIFSLGGP